MAFLGVGLPSHFGVLFVVLVEPERLGIHLPWNIPSSLSEWYEHVNTLVPLILIRTFLSGPYTVPELSVGLVNVSLGGKQLNLTAYLRFFS